MGGKGRAKVLSESLGMTAITKKAFHFMLKKCGNCQLRVHCWSQLFPDMGALINAYREVFFCDGHYKGNAKATVDGKQVVALIKNCEPCPFLEHCISNILGSDEFMGIMDATSDDFSEHVQAIKRCSSCKDNDRCWSGILKGLGFGWGTSKKVIEIMVKCKYRKRDD
ncbi:MAG: hypothetical protein ACTSVR_04855 [Candidatus Thorarchaeota archaeon]